MCLCVTFEACFRVAACTSVFARRGPENPPPPPLPRSQRFVLSCSSHLRLYFASLNRCSFLASAGGGEQAADGESRSTYSGLRTNRKMLEQWTCNCRPVHANLLRSFGFSPCSLLCIRFIFSPFSVQRRCDCHNCFQDQIVWICFFFFCFF